MKPGMGIAAALVLLAGFSGCGGDGSSGGSDSSGEGGSTTLNVYAASSLTSSFEEIAKDFESSHDGVSVELNFAGSSDLVSQIQQGAPADVFASADIANMDKLTADDLVGSGPENFASNTLEIAVPPDNPAGIASLKDLTTEGVNLVICAPEVPCGAASQKVADAAGLSFEPVSEDQSVTDVLNKVATGEADAGLVYVTDVKAAGDSVKGVTFPESAEAVNTYPIATVGTSQNKELAAAFIATVTGSEGRKVLSDAGFGTP